jgi:predicted RNA-binding Zn ribbon-like protein
VDSLCLEFLNSEWGDYRGRFRKDQLLHQGWVRDFLERWQLAPAEPLSPQGLADLVDLRTSLRQLCEALPDREPPPQALHALNAILQSTPLPCLVWSAQQGYSRQEAPVSGAWRRVMSALAVSFADLLVHGEIRRLKVCENPHCRGYFYDETRSGTQRWCITKCANLWKARRFRARLRQAAL